jgi:hypothetical protein
LSPPLERHCDVARDLDVSLAMATSAALIPLVFAESLKHKQIGADLALATMAMAQGAAVIIRLVDAL